MNTRLRILGQILSFALLATFALSACGNPAGPEVKGRAAVERVEVIILESFPVQVNAVAHGWLGDGCTRVDTVTQRRDLEKRTFTVEITTLRPRDAVCTLIARPLEQTIALDVYGLPAGTYTVDVNGVTATFTLSVDNKL